MLNIWGPKLGFQPLRSAIFIGRLTELFDDWLGETQRMGDVPWSFTSTSFSSSDEVIVLELSVDDGSAYTLLASGTSDWVVDSSSDGESLLSKLLSYK